MVRGSEVHRKIKTKLDEVRSQERELSSQVSRTQEEINRLNHQRESLYTQLAVFYLPEMDAESVRGTLRAVQNDVERIFKAKQERANYLDGQILAVGSKRSKLEDNLEKVDSQLNEKVKEREETIGKINEELKADERYVALKTEADHAQASFDQNKKRAETFEQEAKQKLEAYESSRFFMYLVERGVGTDKHRGNNLTKMLDRWVARKIPDFAEQRRNYEFLKSMPEMINRELEDQQEKLYTLVEQLDDIEGVIEEKYGLPTIIEEGTILGRTRENVIDSIERADKERDLYETERKDLDNTRGEYHQKALARLKDFLQSKTINHLKKQARETRDERDDGLVEQIEETDQSINSYASNIKGIREEQAKVVKALKGLEEIEREFVRNDYESRRSRFDTGFDINTLLIGYILGRNSVGEVNSTISRHQDFEPAPTYRSSSSYSYGGGRSSSSSSGWGGGGGFGGGGFSSGRGFGGGGFSSGRGF